MADSASPGIGAGACLVGSVGSFPRCLFRCSFSCSCSSGCVPHFGALSMVSGLVSMVSGLVSMVSGLVF